MFFVYSVLSCSKMLLQLFLLCTSYFNGTFFYCPCPNYSIWNLLIPCMLTWTFFWFLHIQQHCQYFLVIITKIKLYQTQVDQFCTLLTLHLKTAVTQYTRKAKRNCIRISWIVSRITEKILHKAELRLCVVSSWSQTAWDLYSMFTNTVQSWRERQAL